LDDLVEEVVEGTNSILFHPPNCLNFTLNITPNSTLIIRTIISHYFSSEYFSGFNKSIKSHSNILRFVSDAQEGVIGLQKSLQEVCGSILKFGTPSFNE